MVTHIDYMNQEIRYNIYDTSSTEILRLTSAPMMVKVDGVAISPLSPLTAEGWEWTPYTTGGGVLKVMHTGGHDIDILLYPASVESISQSKMKMLVYPNPASGKVNIDFATAHAQTVKIELSDMTGKKVKEISTYAHGGENIQEMDVTEFHSGIYIAKLITLEVESVRKLVVAN